jgi:membrane-associated protease RseP (regulator of RpoE activity)
MKHLLRPYRNFGSFVLVGMAIAVTPPGAHAQGNGIIELVQEGSPLLLHSSTSQGYLGVDLADVDQDKAQSLKLKEVRGAVITLIDHDAPAGQIGLKVNDVVIQINGQDVEGAEQLRRMLREIPAGRKVSLEISRDGNVQTLAVQLVDRRVMEHDVWSKLGTNDDVFAQPSGGKGILKGEGDGGVSGALRFSIFGSTLNVGAFLEPLTSQMAEYLGVANGLMVKQIARKSEAAAAGLRMHDVILKVGSDTITDLASWDRALRANQGKSVQITILRDKKQQTVTLQVDSKHKGELEEPGIFSSDNDCPLLAEVNPDAEVDLGSARGPGAVFELSRQYADAARAAAKALRDQANSIVQLEARPDVEQFEVSPDIMQLQISPKQAEQMRKQAEALRDQLKLQNFQLDPKQMQDMKQQMDAFGKNFKSEDFQLDQKQMQDMKQQMDEFQKNFQPEQHQIAPY